MAVLMLVNSVISVFYYFAVPRQMIFKPAIDETPLQTSRMVTFAVGLAAVDALAADPALAEYRFLHATRADFLRRLGRWGEAADAYERGCRSRK